MEINQTKYREIARWINENWAQATSFESFKDLTAHLNRTFEMKTQTGTIHAMMAAIAGTRDVLLE